MNNIRIYPGLEIKISMREITYERKKILIYGKN
jgi:hypothetical protein